MAYWRFCNGENVNCPKCNQEMTSVVSDSDGLEFTKDTCLHCQLTISHLYDLDYLSHLYDLGHSVWSINHETSKHPICHAPTLDELLRRYRLRVFS